MSSFRVRFTPIKCTPSLTEAAVKNLEQDFARPRFETPRNHQRRSGPKSRSGCRACKQSRVKCDERFPVCSRCDKNGWTCFPNPKRGNQGDEWHIDLSGIMKSCLPLRSSLDKDNQQLLQQWLAQTSNILIVQDRNTINPWSFPILQHLADTPSLFHIILSIAAGHKEFFQHARLQLSLQERCLAISNLRTELENCSRPQITQFLTCYLLGISTSFIADDLSDFGQDHLLASRRMIEPLLSPPSSHTSVVRDSPLYYPSSYNLRTSNPMRNFVVGAFIYWDMSCSMLVDPAKEEPFAEARIVSYIARESIGGIGADHPITGPCLELFYVLGKVGRYCRTAIDTQFDICDPLEELALEQHLLQWKPLHRSKDTTLIHCWNIIAEAFRSHGLLSIYRICRLGRWAKLSISIWDNAQKDEWRTYSDTCSDTLKSEICCIARRTVQALLEIDSSSPLFCLQPIPLMTAAAELTVEDDDLRAKTIARFRALFSYSRLPANITAISLLQDLWTLRDESSINVSWLELMLWKGWRLRLG